MKQGKSGDKSQIQAFRATARELGCDPSEERFNEALKKVARHKPVDRVADEKNQLIDDCSPEALEKREEASQAEIQTPRQVTPGEFAPRVGCFSDA